MRIAYITGPLPTELRERTAEMLRSVRPGDADTALANTKTIEGISWRELGVIILRIEADCRAGLCMTVLARVTDQVIVPELTLVAGRAVLFGDEVVSLWGASASGPDIAFEGPHGTAITVTQRRGTWVVGACSSCLPPIEPVPNPPGPEPEQPASRSRPETFEDFRRAIDRWPGSAE